MLLFLLNIYKYAKTPIEKVGLTSILTGRSHCQSTFYPMEVLICSNEESALFNDAYHQTKKNCDDNGVWFMGAAQEEVKKKEAMRLFSKTWLDQSWIVLGRNLEILEHNLSCFHFKKN